MARGCSIPPAVHWIIIRLSSLLRKDDISTYTGISTRSVERILRYFRRYGTIEVRDPHEERRRKRQLRDLDVEFLFGIVRHTPDMYLDELREMLSLNHGVNPSPSTIWRTLRRGGFTLKKVTSIAAERSAEKRLDYLARISAYQPFQLVFVDESSVDRRTSYRGRAWSIRGSQAQRKAFFVRGRRFSVLPALSLNDGFIHCDIVEGSFCTASFTRFIEGLLNNMQAYPAPNSVIVMDNCRIHKHPDIQAMIRERGMRCEFLPPYSPDFNPIELAFSAMKARLRQDGEYVRMAMTHMTDTEIYVCLLKALYSATPRDAYGWYKYCGYV